MIALAAMAWHYHSVSLLIAALGALLFMIPVSAIFKAPEGWPRWALIAYAAVLGWSPITRSRENCGRWPSRRWVAERSRS